METTDPQVNSSKIIFGEIFKIFLKTGRKRVILSILCGTIIFLAITSLIMVVYARRFETFQTFQDENVDWFSDGTVSIRTNREYFGLLTFPDNFLTNLSDEFISMAQEYVPGLDVYNYSAAISVAVYFFDEYLLSFGGEPWVYEEFMTVDNRTYNTLSNCLIAGRMPENYTELLYYQENSSAYAINDTIEVWTVRDHSTSSYNFNIVGIVDDVGEVFNEERCSVDIFDWSFDDITQFRSNLLIDTFITSFALYQEIFEDFVYNSGIRTYLMDIDYDCTNLKLNRLIDYLEDMPGPANYAWSEILDYYVDLCPDLKVLLIDYSNYWVDEITKILSINAPLIFIMGLLSVVTLNIGSSELGIAFRRMKLYGLSYNTIRGMVFLENFLFSFISLIGGSLLGFGIGYLTTTNINERPTNFYIYFLQEPLLLISITTFFIAFFALSFYIQNSIAKKTAKTTVEEFKQKRSKIRNIFSTNEFRLFTIALIFTIVSLILFFIYRFSGPEATVTSTLSFLTFFWFMIMCSAAFLITFAFLLLARLMTLLWSLLSNRIWGKHLNLFSLSIRHISVNQSFYQIAILGALIFGFVILPGVAMGESIPNHVEIETEMIMGCSSLAIYDWVDPEDIRDGILNNITEIEGYTEVIYYKITETNDDLRYPKAFTIYMVALESPTNFTSIIDTTLLNNSKVSVESVAELEVEDNIFLDQKFARKNGLQPGDLYSSTNFGRYNYNLTVVDSFDYFPLTPLPKKGLFQSFMDVYAMVGSFDTIKEAVRSVSFTTEIYTWSIKLIKPINETVIPQIQEELAEEGILAVSYEDMFNELNSEIQEFQKSNLLFFVYLTIFTLLFVGYFTGRKIFEERGRIIEASYRVGAVKGQILGYFTLEYLLINLLPMITTLLISLPLIKYISVYYIGIEERYYLYKPGIPVWLIILVILGGITISLIGWLISLVPLIYRYKPVKQE